MSVNYNNLFYFYQVAKKGNLSLSAQSLYISQPSLSKAVKDLERDLGVQLFHRTNRTLQAVQDGNTVRVYHQKNEWVKGATDYRPDYCFNITVNPDNSLTLRPWDRFQLVEGGGTYYEDMEVYSLWYTFWDAGRQWITRGFLYKDRQTEDELREINDWMDEHRVYDN